MITACRARRLPRKRLDATSFFVIRLIRLHPLVVIGVTLGLIEYLVDPFAGNDRRGRLTFSSDA